MNAFWLSYLTVREALFKGTLLFFFAISNLIIVFFIFAIDSTNGDLSIFGNPITPRGIPDFNPVDFLFLQLFSNSTFWVILFGLFATAGLIPAMLEKGTVELYVSKPISRPLLLLSRSAGACAGIGINLVYFALAIWLVIGLKTGIWHQGFLLASLTVIPLFFFYYSVVAFISLITNSTGFSIMFALIFWFFSVALNLREMTLYPWWDNVVYHRFLDVLYYATPQVSSMLESATRLIGPDLMRRTTAVAEDGFNPLPFLYSFLSSSMIYAIASWRFLRKDY
jgi:ABC-type transport system involved in multi-copper enzyme maturation permease subunit